MFRDEYVNKHPNTTLSTMTKREEMFRAFRASNNSSNNVASATAPVFLFSDRAYRPPAETQLHPIRLPPLPSFSATVPAATAIAMHAAPISHKQALDFLAQEQQQQQHQAASAATDGTQPLDASRTSEQRKELQQQMKHLDTRIDICIVGGGTCSFIVCIGGLLSGVPRAVVDRWSGSGDTAATQNSQVAHAWVPALFRPSADAVAPSSSSDWNALFGSSQRPLDQNAVATTTRIPSDVAALVPIGIVYPMPTTSSDAATSSSGEADAEPFVRFLAHSFQSVVQIDLHCNTSRLLVLRYFSQRVGILSTERVRALRQCNRVSVSTLWASEEDLFHEMGRTAIYRRLLGLAVLQPSGHAEMCAMLLRGHHDGSTGEFTRLFIFSHAQFSARAASASSAASRQQRYLVQLAAAKTQQQQQNDLDNNSATGVRAGQVALASVTSAAAVSQRCNLPAMLEAIARSVFQQAFFLRTQLLHDSNSSSSGSSSKGMTVFDSMRAALEMQQQQHARQPWPPCRLLVSELGASPTLRAAPVRQMNAALWHGALLLQHEQMRRSALIDREEEAEAAAAAAARGNAAKPAQPPVPPQNEVVAVPQVVDRRPVSLLSQVYLSIVDALKTLQQRQDATALPMARALLQAAGADTRVVVELRSVCVTALYFVARMNGTLPSGGGAMPMLSPATTTSAASATSSDEITAAQVAQLRLEVLRELVLINCMRLMHFGSLDAVQDQIRQRQPTAGQRRHAAVSSVPIPFFSHLPTMTPARLRKALSRAWSWLVKFCRKNAGDAAFAQTVARAFREMPSTSTQPAAHDADAQRRRGRVEEATEATTPAATTTTDVDDESRPWLLARPNFCSMLLRVAAEGLRKQGYLSNFATAAASTSFEAVARALCEERRQSLELCPVCRGNGERRHVGRIGVPLNFFDGGAECAASAAATQQQLQQDRGGQQHQHRVRPHRACISSTTFMTVRLFGAMEDQEARAASDDNNNGADDSAAVVDDVVLDASAEADEVQRLEESEREVVSAMCLVCGCVEAMSADSAHPLCVTCGGLLSI